MTKQEQLERLARKALDATMSQQGILALVNSVRWLDREEPSEFAVIRIWNASDYEALVDWLTTPGNKLRVTRERVGRRETFVYVAWVA